MGNDSKKTEGKQQPDPAEGKQDTAVVEHEAVQPAEIKDGQLMLTEKHRQLIKDQIAPTATKDELELFLMMAYRTRLDPLLKQLYFIKYSDKVSYVTSIDGYRIIAHRTGFFDGVDEPEYKYDGANRLYSCTVRVYRKGSHHAFAATVKFEEYNTGRNLWAKMPESMIAKVAEAHALRKAFPQDLSGIYTTDEMDQANINNAHPQKRAPLPKVSEIKAKMIDDLFKLKGKEDAKESILKFFNVKKATELNVNQATALMVKLNSFPDADEVFLDAQDNPSLHVDPDDAEKGIEAEKKADESDVTIH